MLLIAARLPACGLTPQPSLSAPIRMQPGPAFPRSPHFASAATSFLDLALQPFARRLERQIAALIPRMGRCIDY